MKVEHLKKFTILLSMNTERVEKYYKGSADISYMEIWVIPVETANSKKELSDTNENEIESL